MLYNLGMLYTIMCLHSAPTPLYYAVVQGGSPVRAVCVVLTCVVWVLPVSMDVCVWISWSVPQDLGDKLEELKKTTKAFFSRLKQNRNRPKAVQQLRDSLNVSQNFVSRMDNLSLFLDLDDQVFTEVEKEGLRTLY